MPIVELNRENFQASVSGKGIVIVDCWAAWCGACEQFRPVFEDVAARYTGHTFASLDTVREKELVKGLQIEHIPTLMLYRDGILLFRQPGNYDREGLEDIISQAESLDMDLVRSEIEKGNSG